MNAGEVPTKDLRDIASDLQKQIGSGVVAVVAKSEGKGALIITVTDDLIQKISAVELVKSAAEILGARGGGGKPNFAQTGGPNGDKLDEVVAKIRQIIAG